MVLCSLVCGLAAISEPASAGGARSHTVLHYGDSLTVGTGLYLQRFLEGWTVRQSADVSRHTDAAPVGLRAYGPSLPHVVVISLGANDSPSAVAWFERQVRDVIRIAGPGRCVVWSAVVRPPYNGVSYDRLNAVLRKLDAGNENFLVFDWAALAARHPSWFGSDGVHPTATGYRARAESLALLIRHFC